MAWKERRVNFLARRFEESIVEGSKFTKERTETRKERSIELGEKAPARTPKKKLAHLLWLKNSLLTLQKNRIVIERFGANGY